PRAAVAGRLLSHPSGAPMNQPCLRARSGSRATTSSGQGISCRGRCGRVWIVHAQFRSPTECSRRRWNCAPSAPHAPPLLHQDGGESARRAGEEAWRLFASRERHGSSRGEGRLEYEISGLTLIELLVVIAVIGILAALLVPALCRGRGAA